MKNKIIKLLIVFTLMLTVAMASATLQAKDKKEAAPVVPQQALPKAEVKIKKVSKPTPKKIQPVVKADEALIKNIETLSQQVANQVTANNTAHDVDEEPVVLEDSHVIEDAKAVAAIDQIIKPATNENVLTPLDVMRDKTKAPALALPNILDSKVQEQLPWSKTLTITAFMICTLVSFAFFYSRKFNKNTTGASPSGKQMKLIQTLSLGNKKSVALVEWNKKLVMLGISDNNVNFVSMSESSVSEKTETQTQQQVLPSFHDLLASETLLADSVKVNLSSVADEPKIIPAAKNSSVSERIKGKIGALKSPPFKPLPISNLSFQAKSTTPAQSNSFVVDYSSERGFLKE